MIPPALPPSRRTRLLALAGALLLLLAFAPVASADLLTPESGGSPQADDIDTLYKITLYIAIVIFAIVEGTLLWSLIKHRRRRGGPEAAQIRGNTPLEVGWTIGAAAILVVLTVVTFVLLDDIENPPPSGPNGLPDAEFASIDQPAPPKSGGPTMTIDINGQQYLWRYDYGNGLYSYAEMVIPTNTTVVARVTSSDVVHSWWIPKFGGKVDGVPGHVNETWFKVAKPGVYEGQCAELCGYNHADMRAWVRAVPPDEFQQWARDKKQQIEDAGKELAEQREQRGNSEATGEAE
jgi:cytochrome c oxidase subunit II